ncbi:hypothetical protein FKM82_030465 [Ascaphus truei]
MLPHTLSGHPFPRSLCTERCGQSLKTANPSVADTLGLALISGGLVRSVQRWFCYLPLLRSHLRGRGVRPASLIIPNSCFSIVFTCKNAPHRLTASERPPM